MYIRQGARIVYVAQVTGSTFLSSFADVLSRVTGDLANQDTIIIEKQKTESASWFSSDLTVTLNLFINGSDYANENDVRAIVDHAFYAQTGNLPVASRVTSVQSPGATTGTATGAPQAPKEDDGGGIFDGLGDKLVGGGYGLAFGAIGVVLLLGFLAAKAA